MKILFVGLNNVKAIGNLRKTGITQHLVDQYGLVGACTHTLLYVSPCRQGIRGFASWLFGIKLATG
jgi:hypothetical protein